VLGAAVVVRADPRWPDATVVAEIFDCSQVLEDQRVDIDNGNIWVEACARRWNGLTSCARASQGQPRRASAPGKRYLRRH
jgi:hypothetical protein